MRKRRFWMLLVSSLLAFTSLASCQDNSSNTGTTDMESTTSTATSKIEYKEYEKSTIGFTDNSSSSSLTSFDKNVYYINDLKLDMGDPMVVYDNGMFYAYGTRGTTTFHCFKSPNLQDWVRIDDCFVPESSSWGTYDLWAPDIKKIGNKWYLYYTATKKYDDGYTCQQLGVAVSDNPYGPFVQYTGTNANNETIGLKDVPFQGLERNTILDSTVFEDDDGQLYMYFSYDTRTITEEARDKFGIVSTNSAEIFGVKMKDPVTWDLSTLTRLMSAGLKNISDSKRTIDWETWSESFGSGMECLEGPFMLKHNGKYYLTYCANSYVDTVYGVGYAISDSPLGQYTKPDDKYLENLLLGVPGALGTYINTRYLGFMTGTGHASIFKIGDEYMFAYHAHTNRDVWGKEGTENPTYRSLAFDYIYFDDNGLPYTNGPTYSLQRLPKAISGYSNIASEANFVIEGENPEYLNDNFTNRGAGRVEDEPIKDALFLAGTRSIEITFSKPRKIKGLNIYNSCEFDKKTEFIKQIDFGNDKGIVNVMFNQKYINYNQKFINPHTAYNVLLDEELETNRIVITFESTSDFGVGEIEILGE